MKITKEKVLLLHQLLVQETGGADGLRDEGLRPPSKNGHKKASKNEMNRSISLIY